MVPVRGIDSASGSFLARDANGAEPQALLVRVLLRIDATIHLTVLCPETSGLVPLLKLVVNLGPRQVKGLSTD